MWAPPVCPVGGQSSWTPTEQRFEGESKSGCQQTTWFLLAPLLTTRPPDTTGRLGTRTIGSVASLGVGCTDSRQPPCQELTIVGATYTGCCTPCQCFWNLSRCQDSLGSHLPAGRGQERPAGSADKGDATRACQSGSGAAATDACRARCPRTGQWPRARTHARPRGVDLRNLHASFLSFRRFRNSQLRRASETVSSVASRRVGCTDSRPPPCQELPLRSEKSTLGMESDDYRCNLPGAMGGS